MAETNSYDNGEWTAVTLGVFIQILVDSGRDPVAIFRVVEDGKPDKDGRFVRKMEVVLAPDNHVVEQIMATGAKAVHKVLKEFIEKGLIE